MKFLATLLATGMLFTPFVYERNSVNMHVLPEEIVVNEDAEPRLFTQMTVGLTISDGKIYANAMNTFTLFFTDVPTYIMLYASTNEPSDYHEMTLMSTNYTEDLDMGQTISTSYTFDGVTRYWLARVLYREGDGDWSEKVGRIERYDGNGNPLPPESLPRFS